MHSSPSSPPSSLPLVPFSGLRGWGGGGGGGAYTKPASNLVLKSNNWEPHVASIGAATGHNEEPLECRNHFSAPIHFTYSDLLRPPPTPTSSSYLIVIPFFAILLLLLLLFTSFISFYRISFPSLSNGGCVSAVGFLFLFRILWGFSGVPDF